MSDPIVVIGGGPAGMAAAIAAAASGAKVILLERKSRVGTKLLSTGNGRCNLGNPLVKPEAYHCAQDEKAGESFTASVTSDFGYRDLTVWMESLGIAVTLKNGFAYPRSLQASTVRNALEEKCLALGVKIVTDCLVTSIEKKGENFLLTCEEQIPAVRPDKNKKTGKSAGKASGKSILFGKAKDTAAAAEATGLPFQKTYHASAVILAGGSKAAPKTGSDGSSYLLAASFGHTIIEPLPALVPLHSSSDLCRKLSGVRVDAACTLYYDGEAQETITGELQCTDYGISGFPIFQLSGRALRRPPAMIKIDFLPDLSASEAMDALLYFRKLNPDKKCRDWLGAFLPDKICEAFCEIQHIPAHQTAKDATKEQVSGLVFSLKNSRFPVVGSEGFDRAQTCSGGVSIREVSQTAMESLLCPGLYLAGECLDIDGLCGGFNLHFAFATGITAGRSCAVSLGRKEAGESTVLPATALTYSKAPADQEGQKEPARFSFTDSFRSILPEKC